MQKSRMMNIRCKEGIEFENDALTQRQNQRIHELENYWEKLDDMLNEMVVDNLTLKSGNNEEYASHVATMMDDIEKEVHGIRCYPEPWHPDLIKASRRQ